VADTGAALFGKRVFVGAAAGKLATAAVVTLDVVGLGLPATAAIVGMGGVGVPSGGVGRISPANANIATTPKMRAPPITHPAIARPCEDWAD